MDILLALIILLVALAALALPLYRSGSQPQYIAATTLDDLYALRDGVYATLRDLDLDHTLGKLDDDDYHTLRETNLARAAEVLQRLDQLTGVQNVGAGEEIEKEVAALRRQPNVTGDMQKASGPVLPRGASAEATTQLKDELRCANCGRPYHAGDRFCAQCGNTLG